MDAVSNYCRLLLTEPALFIVGAGRAEFHLHRGLVGCLSAPLDALVNRGAANLQDTTVAVFSAFAQFVYSGHYDLEGSASARRGSIDTCTQHNILVQHAQLWVFAQRYHIEPLKRVVEMQLTNKLSICTMSPVTFVAEFGELVRYVYGTSFSLELRQIVSQFAAPLTLGLYHLEGWKNLLSRCPGFLRDTLNAMIQIEGW